MKKNNIFLKDKRLSFTLFLATVVLTGIGYAISVLEVAGRYCDYICRGNIWEPVMFFAASSVIGAFSLLFVRGQVIGTWLFFALPYVLISAMFLSTQSTGSSFGPSFRVGYAIALGAAFSIATIIWMTAHTLIIRRSEKRNS